VGLAVLVGITVLLVLVAMGVAGYLIEKDAGRKESRPR
jgi:hypothetical protein